MSTAGAAPISGSRCTTSRPGATVSATGCSRRWCTRSRSRPCGSSTAPSWAATSRQSGTPTRFSSMTPRCAPAGPSPAPWCRGSPKASGRSTVTPTAQRIPTAWLDYALFTDVDPPLIAELSVDADPYDLTENVALNTAEAGFWSVFDPVDCATPPLLGLGSYAIDRGEPREGDLDDDGSLPDLGAYSGPYALELPDADGDGYRLGLDCDDTDDEVHPGQLDAVRDGVDDDCDGQDAPGGDDTGADDSGEAAQDAPLQFDYFGGRSCGGGGVDTGEAAALLFLGAFTRRRRP
ncbi:MAG: putative metal-binding motif-containing protein [Deltaproteobacteria bacterium]|nr:putative metal-binding motif-containing protein [Deltaproteobacteria bacterium]